MVKKNGLTDVNILDLKENGSVKGDPLMWKSLQGENCVQVSAERCVCVHV